MTRRLLGGLLWLSLLPIVGSFRLLWFLLRLLASFQPRTVLVLVGLAVALSLPSPLSAQLAEAGIWPMGHVILVRVGLALAALVLYHGLRSPGLHRLRRGLWHCG
jgi:hypothetical protein